jgi:hypothetical protein
VDYTGIAEAIEVVAGPITAAAIEDLTPTPEDRHAAIADYQADRGLSRAQMELELRQYVPLREVEDHARRVKLMRIYAGHWRVWDSEDRSTVRCARRPRGELTKRGRGRKFVQSCPSVAPEDDDFAKVTA